MNKKLIPSFKANLLKNKEEIGEFILLNDKYCQEITWISKHGGINTCFNEKPCKLHD